MRLTLFRRSKYGEVQRLRCNTHARVAGEIRGMRNAVILFKDNIPSLAKLETALADFLFEARVQIG